MKRLIVIAATLLTLAGVSALTATASSASVCQGNGTGCTKAGTYTENAVVNGDYGGVFKVVWVKSVVASYPSGSIPVKWTAYVNYTNVSSSTQTLNCNGADNTSIQENLSGGSGDTNGYVSASSSLCSQNPDYSVTVPKGGTTTDWAVFGNVPWPGTSVSLTWDAGVVGTSPYIYPFGSGDKDWADSSFCSSYDAHAGTTFRGVTACGNSEAVGNDQGTISYLPPSGSRVYFDSVGFQCVELAARYLYFQTLLVPDGRYTPGTGTDFVSTEHKNYSQIAISGVTDTFQGSITPGNIISMWSKSDPTGEGHVGVVMGFQYTGGDLTGINIMDENANGTGTSTIKVSGKTMSFDGYDQYQWTTNLPGSG
jgi:hypothetical protein